MTRKWSPVTTFVFQLKSSLSDYVVAPLNPTKPPKPYFSFLPSHYFPVSDSLAPFFFNRLRCGPRGCLLTSFGWKHHRFEHPITWRHSFCHLPIFYFPKWRFVRVFSVFFPFLSVSPSVLLSASHSRQGFARATSFSSLVSPPHQMHEFIFSSCIPGFFKI